MTFSSITDKSALRAYFRELRQGMDAQARADAGAAVCAALAGVIPADAVCVAGYAAIGAEIDVFPALANCAAAALPVTQGNNLPLLFRAWKPGDALIPGAYGIPVPELSAQELVPDVILVPLLAFDAKGHRLGYGGGYYDRTLRQLRARGLKKAIGIAYAAQAHPALPAETHDEPLDAIVTEHGAVIPA